MPPPVGERSHFALGFFLPSVLSRRRVTNGVQSLRPPVLSGHLLPPVRSNRSFRLGEGGKEDGNLKPDTFSPPKVCGSTDTDLHNLRLSSTPVLPFLRSFYFPFISPKWVSALGQ